jgi:hypothetical protein
MKVTAISPDADDPRETAPSPLSQLHPGHAGELARFLSLEAGWTTADLDLLDGDEEFTAEEFTAEVEAEMRALRAPGGAR